jgi:hypothetical protein
LSTSIQKSDIQITVNYKKGQRLMNVDSPVSIRKKQASQELLQMIQTKSPPKVKSEFFQLSFDSQAPSTEKEKENASKHILGMINPFGSSNRPAKTGLQSGNYNFRFQKPSGPPFQKQFAKKGNLKTKNAQNSSPGKFQKFQKNSQKRKHKIEDTRGIFLTNYKIKKHSVVISEPEIRSENPPIAEKINEENLAETQIPQILIQEEDEISAEEEEATTVAVRAF